MIPQMNEDRDDYAFQQNGCRAQCQNDVRDYLNTNLPQRIGRFGQDSVALKS